jgi:hypothetical protein
MVVLGGKVFRSKLTTHYSVLFYFVHVFAKQVHYHLGLLGGKIKNNNKMKGKGKAIFT